MGAATELRPGPRDPAPGPVSAADLPVVLGPGSRFEGLLTYRGAARIDGELVGEVRCRGTLQIGESGRVEGIVEVDELIVAGELEGEAHARERIALLATARVRGVIRAAAVSMADGCWLEGRCHTEPVSGG